MLEILKIHHVSVYGLVDVRVDQHIRLLGTQEAENLGSTVRGRAHVRLVVEMLVIEIEEIYRRKEVKTKSGISRTESDDHGEMESDVAGK